MRWLLIGLVRLYQRLVSPVLNAISGPRCRFVGSPGTELEFAL